MSAVADPIAEPQVLPVVTIDAGLPGFPRAQHFVLMRWGDEDSPFSLLRCLDIDDLEFVVVPPEVFFPDYRPDIDATSAERLGLRTPDDALILVILTLGERPQDATANLLGPVVINRHTRQASQVVLASAHHSVRAPLASN